MKARWQAAAASFNHGERQSLGRDDRREPFPRLRHRVETDRVERRRAVEILLGDQDHLAPFADALGGQFYAEVRAAARAAGERLRDLGLVPFAMTTGSRGLHVVCPLRRGPDFLEVHGFARALAEAMVADDPRHLTLEWHKADRGKRIYLDVNRIAYAQHAVAPYAIRARPNAPVAVPLHWEELSDPALQPDRWTVNNLAARLGDGDPWDGMSRHARALPR